MREIKRFKVMSMVEEKLMTRAKAAEKLNISERQVYRIQKSYREKGEQGLVHGNRGKPSRRRVSKQVCTKIKTLLENNILTTIHCTFRRYWQKNLGSTSATVPCRASGGEQGTRPLEKIISPHRNRRTPKPIYGMMLQADASIHPCSRSWA